MTVAPETPGVEISAQDIDSLSILPLAMLPLETEDLRRVRMVKDSSMRSAVELFSGVGVGSGLIYPAKLQECFPRITAEDQVMLGSVAELRSFDVYSLRISLRNIGIEVENTRYLRLSEEKQRELREYTRPFIESLARKIYGDDSADSETNSLASLIRDPNIKTARQKLRNMATDLAIPLHEMPLFLADYGDIYLSVGYFRNCFDNILPSIEDFVFTLREITQHDQMKQNAELMKVCHRLEEKLNKIQEALRSRFSTFSRNTDAMWKNLNAAQFERFRHLVDENHKVLGSLLCMLTIKMTVWSAKFPAGNVAGPARRADFIMTEMRQGL